MSTGLEMRVYKFRKMIGAPERDAKGRTICRWAWLAEYLRPIVEAHERNKRDDEAREALQAKRREGYVTVKTLDGREKRYQPRGND